MSGTAERIAIIKLNDEEIAMKTKITVITDNIPNGGLSGEWGLCLLVEYKDKKILVDAGASELFLTNLKELGFEANDVDYATLSHAHYDHAYGHRHNHSHGIMIDGIDNLPVGLLILYDER